MNTAYQEIIRLFVDEYGLSRGEVIAEIEKTFSSMLSRWHRKNVVALFTGGELRALAYDYHGQGGVVQVPLDLVTMRGWNTIQRMIQQNLGKAASLKEVARYKNKAHQLFWGEIKRKNRDHSLSVEIEIEPGVPMMATCLAQHLGVHERDEINVGQRRAFHLRRVDPIDLHGTVRTRILVDRVSKHLVTRLIQSQVDGKIRVRCLKRYVGHKSFVETDRFIPRKIILAVSRELNEHVQVKVRTVGRQT